MSARQQANAMDKNHDIENSAEQESSEESTSRREFLRRSVYAAYATPLITALLVEKASAGNSTSQTSGCTQSGWQPQKCDGTP